MGQFLPSAVDFNLTYDPQDPRLGFHRTPLNDSNTVLVGYPDDRGIRANGGRPGAALAPDVIRKYLFKMTPMLGQETVSFFDAGNFVSEAPLSDTQIKIQSELSDFYKQNKRIVSFGGGHDFGFPDTSAFAKHVGASKPLIINFDAHLDVRPTSKGVTSGTPFSQLIELYPAKQSPPFDFIEVGIQPQCNSREHLKWLIDRGGHILEISNWTNLFKQFASLLTSQRPTFISVDIDFFSSAVAPGCSQSWATGAMPHEFFQVFDHLLSRLDVRALGIYEVSPPLDIDDQTSKLAALIAHRFIYSGATS